MRAAATPEASHTIYLGLLHAIAAELPTNEEIARRNRIGWNEPGPARVRKGEPPDWAQTEKRSELP